VKPIARLKYIESRRLNINRSCTQTGTVKGEGKKKKTDKVSSHVVHNNMASSRQESRKSETTNSASSQLLKTLEENSDYFLCHPFFIKTLPDVVGNLLC
jgi:hypothetical protein